MRYKGAMRRAWIVVLLTGIGAGMAQAADAKVVIVGGCDETGHEYTWQVTNRSSSRIVRIEFPHYAADLFSTPENWRQGTLKEMNLVNPGWKSKEGGVCWAEAKPPYPGLAPGQPATFGMRVAGMGALRGTASVRVVFADGTSTLVPGVELPQQPVRGSPYLALIGTGLIFGLFIVIREVRRRRHPPATSADSSDAPAE